MMVDVSKRLPENCLIRYVCLVRVDIEINYFNKYFKFQMILPTHSVVFFFAVLELENISLMICILN